MRLPYEDNYWGLFLEDGSLITDDDVLLDKDIVNVGETLFLRRSWYTASDSSKHFSTLVHLQSFVIKQSILQTAICRV